MTSLVREGFDIYPGAGSSGMTDAGGKWSSVSSCNLSTTTRFATGKSLGATSTGGDMLVPRASAGSTNESVWFVTVAFIQTTGLTGSTQGWGFQLTDGASTQCGFWFRTDGAIVFRNGGSGGTVLATFTGAFAAGSYDHWQVKIIVDNANGEIHIRKNGASSDTFSATGLDTTTTANNYANGAKGNAGGNIIGAGHIIDDLWIYNGNNASSPYDWIGDVRCIPSAGTFDSAVQFSRSATGTSLACGTTATGTTVAITAGTIYMGLAFSVSQGGTISSCTVNVSAGFTGNLRVGFYMLNGDLAGFSSGNLPGDLVGTSSTLNNPVTGNNTVTFSSPIPVMNGWGYIFALQSDTNFTMVATTNGSARGSYSGSFGAGLPATLAGATNVGNTNRLTISATVSPNNAGCDNDATYDDATTYVYDNVVGQKDLYNVSPIGYVPLTVFGLDLIGRVAKSDSGGRGSKLQLSSGGTLSETSEYNPITSFSWQMASYDTDPNTGLAWTSSGITNMLIGGKVSS